MEKIASELAKNIEDLSSVYLVLGEEDYLIDGFLRRIKEKLLPAELISFNSVKVYEEDENSLQKLREAVKTAPMMGERKLVFFYTKGILAGKGKEEVGQVFLQILDKLFPGVFLFIIAGSAIDKRTKIYKETAKKVNIISADSVKGRQLNNWIEKKFAEAGKTIEREAREFLSYTFMNRLQFIHNEIKKIILYTDEKEHVDLQDIKEVVARDRVLQDKVIFEWVDLISKRDMAGALELMRDMLRAGYQGIYLFVMLARQIRLLAVSWELREAGLNYKKAAEKMGLPSAYPIEKCYSFVRRFSRAELEYLWREIFAVNLRVVQGKMDWVPAIELFLLKLHNLKNEKTRSSF